MTENATIGALRVVLGLDAASFENGLKSAQKSLGGFNASMVKGAAIAGAAVGAALVGVGYAIKKSIDDFDELGKTAQKIGIPVDQLSKLRYAADLSGVSVETLGTALGIFGKKISEAAGGSEEAQRSLARVGVSARDANGSMTTVSAGIEQVAKRFEQIGENGKPALALDAFGRAGRELLPLLNSGAQGLRDMYREAEQLGLVIDEKTYRAAEQFNDNLTRLTRVGQGFATQLTAQLVPALNVLSGALVKGVKESGALEQIGPRIADSIYKITFAAVAVSAAYERMGLTLTAVHNLLKADLTDVGAFKEAWAAVSAVLQGNREVFNALPERVRALIASFNEAGTAALGFAGNANAPAIATNNFKKAIDELRVKAIELQGGFSMLAPGFVQQAISLGIMDAAAAKSGLTVADLTEKQRQLNQALWGEEGAKRWQESLTQFEVYRQKIEQLNVDLANNAINSETHARLVKKAAQEIGNTWEQVSASIAGSIQGAASAFGKEYAGMAKAAQIAGAVQALINAYIGASTALASGVWPQNLAAAASVLAAGIGFAATIKSVAIPAAAQGGSFMVPGGMSGTDNKLIPMALAAGERVDVTPANRATEPSGVKVVRIEGLNKPRYTIDEVKSILDVAGQAIRDGYTFEVATR